MIQVTDLRPGYWADDAACAGKWDIFDLAAEGRPGRPGRDMDTTSRPARARIIASQVCASCPVRRKCAQDAIDSGLSGVFVAGVSIPVSCFGPDQASINARLGFIVSDLTP